MRDIKFRAYGGVPIRMFDVQLIEWKPNGEINNIWDEEGVKYNNSIPIVQFTGLKDKNGNDIYEGDILKGLRDGNIDYSDKVVHVEYEGSAFIESYFRAPLDNYTNMSYGYGNVLEVIGNIHENPELLKRKDNT